MIDFCIGLICDGVDNYLFSPFPFLSESSSELGSTQSEVIQIEFCQKSPQKVRFLNKISDSQKLVYFGYILKRNCTFMLCKIGEPKIFINLSFDVKTEKNSF